MSTVSGPQRTSLATLTARLVHGVSGQAVVSRALPTQTPPSLVSAPERELLRFLLDTTVSRALLPLSKSGAQHTAAPLICNFLIGTLGPLALQHAEADGSQDSVSSPFILVVVVESSRIL